MRLLMNINEDRIKEKLFKNGLESFQKHEFYDAHEYWEDLWSDYRLEDAKFIQGLIQLAVGYFHISNNNKNGALGLFNKCIPKLKPYQPEYRGINIIQVLVSVHKSLEFLSTNDIKKFNWHLVPNLIKK